MHLRINFEDDMKFIKNMLARTVSKINGKTGKRVNKVVVAEKSLVDLYWHGHHAKGTGWRKFVYLLMDGGVMPEFPSGKNTSLWVDTCVAKQLCGGRRQCHHCCHFRKVDDTPKHQYMKLRLLGQQKIADSSRHSDSH